MNKILKAFTLIELLVVIAVIGILSGLIVVSMSGVNDKATMAKAQAFSSSLRNSFMSNIVAEWNFENSSNLGLDSWSTNNCTNVGTPVQATNCMSGNCLSFNGTANNLSCLNNSNLQITGDQTIEMWLYPTDLTARRNPINKTYGGEGTITQEIGGTFNYYWGTSGANVNPYQGVGTGIYAISLNKWSHVAVTRNLSVLPRRIKWYFNGALVVDSPASYAAATASTEPILIGAGYCSPYHGKIDNLRLYNSAISAIQLKENYYAGLNSLLISGNIDKEEYLSRINLVANNE